MTLSFWRVFFFYFFIYFIIVTSVKNRRRFPTDELCSVVPWVPNKNASAQLESKHGQELAQSETERSSASEGSHAPASRALYQSFSIFVICTCWWFIRVFMIHYVYFLICISTMIIYCFFKSEMSYPIDQALDQYLWGTRKQSIKISIFVRSVLVDDLSKFLWFLIFSNISTIIIHCFFKARMSNTQ